MTEEADEHPTVSLARSEALARATQIESAFARSGGYDANRVVRVATVFEQYLTGTTPKENA